jgi:toxin ParE1/3/4
MADYVLSKKADGDLTDIYLYSYRAFGEAKADAYFLSLRDCLRTLAENPRMGRAVHDLRPGLLCHRHARHIVFYLEENGGIFIVRVLHDSMDAPRHLAPEDSDRG